MVDGALLSLFATCLAFHQSRAKIPPRVGAVVVVPVAIGVDVQGVRGAVVGVAIGRAEPPVRRGKKRAAP